MTRAGRADACGCCGRRAAESCWRGHPPPPHRRRGPLRTASGGRRPEGARKPNRKPTRKPSENLPKTSFGPHPHGTAPLSKTISNQVFERYSGWFSGGFRGGFRAGFRGGFRGGSGGGIREVFVRFSAWFSRGGAVRAWWATLRGLAPAGLPVAKPLAVAVQQIFAASVLQAFLPR